MDVLITGGAGFIGSSIATHLVDRGARVRVLDDLSTGYAANVPPAAELIEGDVADEVVVGKAVQGVDLVFHQAARRSVLASVERPLDTDLTNTHGTLTVLKAALDSGARRVVYASSSSVYGGAGQHAVAETAPAMPRSPYAVSKLAGELYCRVFAELYGLETVVLRYFNVYGPRQRPDSAYAAVIPLFIAALADGQPPVVHGDGLQTRDFSFIDDVVAANMAAVAAPAEIVSGRAYNVAGGGGYSLLDLLVAIGAILGVEPQPVHTDPRAGDVRHSRADITRAQGDLGYDPQVSLADGLQRTVAWFSGHEPSPVATGSD